MTYKTLTVPLTEHEWQALCDCAQSEYRNPKQQAIFLLHTIMGIDKPTGNATKSVITAPIGVGTYTEVIR